MTDDDSAAARAVKHAQDHAAKRFANKLRTIDGRARQYRSPGLMLPILAADPDPDEATNMWMLADGRLRVRMPDGTVMQASLTVTGSPTSTVALPADPSPERYEKIYTATWARTFCTLHGVETGPSLGYGKDAQHGNRQAMIGFSTATIAADLAGAVIRSVELSMLNTAAWDPTGVDVSFGAHNQTTSPASFLATRRNVFTDHWPTVGAGDEWRRAPDWYGRALRDGLAAGITIDQPPGLPFTGEFAPASIQLRISFTK